MVEFRDVFVFCALYSGVVLTALIFTVFPGRPAKAPVRRDSSLGD